MKSQMLRAVFLMPVAALLVSSGAQAQVEGAHKQKRVFKRTAMLERHLDLKESQADEIYQLLLGALDGSQCKEVVKYSQLKKCRMETKRNVQTEIEAILDDEQIERFQDLKARLRQRKGMRKFSRRSKMNWSQQRPPERLREPDVAQRPAWGEHDW